MDDNLIVEKSRSFAIQVIRLYQHLTENSKEYVLSKQVLRSGTSIGANVREATQAQSKKDFIAKMQIALKEASETEYWLDLLHETDYITDKEYQSIADDCSRINRILIAILKTAKK